jgi:hypothetical protein
MRLVARLRAAAACLLPALVLTLGVGITVPAEAHESDDLEKVRAELGSPTGTAALSSPNVTHVGAQPSQLGISGCFMKTAPLFVMSGLDSVRVFDVSDATHPELVGILPSAQFENEAMNCAEQRSREGTRRFALIGVDLHQASPDDIEHVNAGDGNELVVVEVTDPTAPAVVSRAPSTTSTHTVACVTQWDCDYAYTAGNGSSESDEGEFTIFDLRDLDHPAEVDSDATAAGVQPFSSPTAGHKWNFDAAGFGTHTGYRGSSMWDLSDPARPALVTSTGEAGRSAGWNDFIHHNSFRPNADAFRADAEPSFANGNVLLVTEEDYVQTDCATAGSFQTWWVKRLDGTPGAIVPLDRVELADLGSYPLPQGAFCSAHWFDYHPSGVVAIGYYGGGTQLVDVRDPQQLAPYGHALWGASQVWDAMYVPIYSKKDRVTDRMSNVVYSIDLVRGLDVYVVDLPGDGIDGATTTQGATQAESSALSPARMLPVGMVGAAGVFAVGLRQRRRKTR